MPASTLKPGYYRITSRAFNKSIGRAIPEDRSLAPKKIVSHKDDSIDAEAVRWKLSAGSSDGKYKLEVLGAPIYEERGQIFAALLPGSQAEEWTIQARDYQGKNTYTIVKSNRLLNQGWILTGEEAQVQNRVLVSTPTLPPVFASHQLWVIVPYPGDDDSE
ncbi:hypothetical protein DXG03_009625 [Asterophora parasitica]|uniref:Uncharacterized protein n=1 Tax=Asterophora parasitica TaxID=117018 RepID=A0A9P7G482_9AGAR|nr:hypothetical protein DXG03_009625 [Asterophora parasitica]